MSEWGSLRAEKIGEPREVTSDDHYTPEWCMKMFSSYHDPCPAQSTRDGLSYDWCEFHDQVYVNPPYSDPMPWVKKAIKEISIYPDSTIVMLLKHDSSTRWYQLLVEAGARFWMLQGRMNFTGPNQIKGATAPFPSVLVVLS